MKWSVTMTDHTITISHIIVSCSTEQGANDLLMFSEAEEKIPRRQKIGIQCCGFISSAFMKNVNQYVLLTLVFHGTLAAEMGTQLSKHGAFFSAVLDWLTKEENGG